MTSEGSGLGLHRWDKRPSGSIPPLLFVKGGVARIELATSCTRSKNHTTRPICHSNLGVEHYLSKRKVVGSNPACDLFLVGKTEFPIVLRHNGIELMTNGLLDQRSTD